jgi:hypothetical protein
LIHFDESSNNCEANEENLIKAERQTPATSGTAAAVAGGGNTFVSNNGKFMATWVIDAALTKITFTMSGTKGWVGIGYNPTGKMLNADMAVGWVDDNTGIGYLFDV